MASLGSAPSSVPAAERRSQAAPNQGSVPPHSAVTRNAVPSGNIIRKAARGGRDFGRAFWKPLSTAGRALWHEVTGLFFALFALFFAQGLWRLRGAWRMGPEHRHFAIDLAMTILFLYFSISAFVHSRRTPH